jgi:DNA helicase II / ATP-dependent DNA helicase PcrA
MLKLYEAHQEHLRVNDQLDFDDLILNAIRLLRINDGVRGYWQSRYQHVLVDEYQDIEPAQELLVRLVAAGFEPPTSRV